MLIQRSPTVECEDEGQAEVLDDLSLLNNGMYCSLRQKKKSNKGEEEIMAPFNKLWLFNASLAQRNGHNAKLAWILPKFSIPDGYATNRGKQPITFHQQVKISPPPPPTLALSFVLYYSGASKLGQTAIKLRQNAGICLDLPVVWAQG
ncbi:unnamed protein product [Nezara viridula]|uniref:Uncharacterized protein n=1 Tax=Nezara viridula TaxID=85310 RepID=A0A9P0DZ67_NEZVI|nr:unnamed protein product [Nezara viridula]